MTTSLQPIIDYLESAGSAISMDDLKALLEKQDLKRADLSEYCIFGQTTYRRNMVRRSDWYEMLVLCWRPGQRSPIHDHHGSSCAFKIIEGSATETVCHPTGGERDGRPLVRVVKVNRLATGHVCASGSSDIHEVANESISDSDLITLHIYSPPLEMRLYRLEDAIDEAPRVTPRLPG